MNRRQLLTATGTSLGILLMNTQHSLTRLQYLANETPEPESKPEFSHRRQTSGQSLYLGALFTWLELLEDTIQSLVPAIEAVQDDANSDSSKAMVLMPLGVWTHLAADTLKITAPATFETVHEHTVDAFSHLGSAAEIISTGVMAGSATAISLGTEHINLATEHVGLLVAELPFERPKREEIIG